MLSPGSRLGPYEVVSSLGAGGMGEVYRARDTELDRDVALKILPEPFASDRERLARFGREARTLAALNHPHIAQIYGVEDSPGGRALVMELVEGEDLAQRIARGPVPPDEALPIARQIAEALEAAHDQGIIHRDLKPANIKLRPDGAVKVLDFGLAKALDPVHAEDSGFALQNSPTITSPVAMTMRGVILGTAAYMAPEQAKGKPVDKRADIWAFGVVLFEMLTGRRLFGGETLSDVLAAVLRQDVDWARLPPETGDGVRRLLTRCLDRDPRARLRDIGEARIALAEGAEATQPGAPEAVFSRRAFVLATAVLGVALAVVFVLWGGASAPAPGRPTRFDIRPPDGAALGLDSRPGVSVAPDGAVIVFTATKDGIARLYVRRRDTVEAVPMPGTEGAGNPVVSPDGRAVAFFAGNTLKKVPFDGPVVSLASGLNDPRGISWLDPSTIVYAPGSTGGLVMMSAEGGEPRTLTTPDIAAGERTHRWPAALPGGRAIVFTIGTFDRPDDYEDSTIDAVIVATGERHTLYRGASSARPTTTGHLLVVRGSALYAVPIDANTLAVQGSAVPVLQGAAGDRTTGAAHVSVAADGTLVYIAGDAGLLSQRRLAWVDSAGTVSALPGLAEGVYHDVRVSPDGSRIAVVTGSAGGRDVWIYDVARTTFTRLTFTGVNATPFWSADGTMVYYAAIDSSGQETVIWRTLVDGARDAEPVVTIDSRAYINALQSDAAIVDYHSQTRRSDLMRVPLDASEPPVPIVATDYDEYGAAVSPDGAWLAYQSDESGRFEVYARALAAGGGRYQVSTALGEEPRWAPDGRTLYYRAGNLLMAVPVDTRGTFSAGTPHVFFSDADNLRSDTGMSFDVDPRTGRLLMIRAAGDRARAAPAIRVVLDWFEELKARTER